MALKPEVRENYVELQQSTGERFGAMADRVASPASLQMYDAAGRDGALELADWLRRQKDDEDAILRVTDPIAYGRREAGDKPQGRSATGNKQNG